MGDPWLSCHLECFCNSRGRLRGGGGGEDVVSPVGAVEARMMQYERSGGHERLQTGRVSHPGTAVLVKALRLVHAAAGVGGGHCLWLVGH